MRGGLRRLCLAAGSRLAPPRASAPALPGPLPPRLRRRVPRLAPRLRLRPVPRPARRPPRRGGPGPAPPAASDPWEEVRDETTGQSYWWNVQTNETTALGAQKPDPSHPPPARRPRAGAGAGPNALARPRSGGGMLGGFGAMVAEGMAFGTGSAIAHRAIGSIFGGGGGYYGGGGGAAAGLQRGLGGGAVSAGSARREHGRARGDGVGRRGVLRGGRRRMVRRLRRLRLRLRRETV